MPKLVVVERNQFHTVEVGVLVDDDLAAPGGQVDGPDLVGQGDAESGLHLGQLLGSGWGGVGNLLGDQPGQGGRVGAVCGAGGHGRVGAATVQGG